MIFCNYRQATCDFEVERATPSLLDGLSVFPREVDEDFLQLARVHSSIRAYTMRACLMGRIGSIMSQHSREVFG